MASAPAYSAVIDGFQTVQGGVDSGNNPAIIEKDQLAYAINATCRGGYVQQRKAWRKLSLTFNATPGYGSVAEVTPAQNRVLFEDGLFQKAIAYSPTSGGPYLVSGHGGHIFRVNLGNNDHDVDDISIQGDLQSPSVRRFWYVQAEDYLLCQDGYSACFIHNGAVSRRAIASEKEVPCGTAMGYCMGRLWVAAGREYIGGDLVGGDTGILKFTENDYILTGGAFSVPAQCRSITAFKPIANIDTALGEGGLIIFTPDDVFYLYVPFDRTEWKNTTGMPLQRITVLKYGTLSPDSVVPVNSDLFYRSKDGLRSIRFAVRDFETWANTALSSELDRIIRLDDLAMLTDSSGALLDNRYLFTVSPSFNRDHGTWHQGLGVVDFSPISGITKTKTPVYDGIWTGQKILQILNVEVNGVDRAFAYVLNPNNQIEIWELDLEELLDDTAEDGRIIWDFETRSMDFDRPTEEKRLTTAELWFDSIGGTVEFSVSYRPDQYPGWVPWHTWTETAPYGIAEPPVDLNFPMLQYRPRVGLPQPLDTVDETVGRPFRHGFEFSFRIQVKGPARIKRFIAKAERLPETEFGRIV